YEPVAALDGGMDGLVIHRRIFEGAVERLLPGGRIYVEIQFDQGQTVREIAESHAEFEDVRLLKDHAGHQRVLTALRK
ncbi:MAG: release factor glutamine methyltransferase, partial [Humisphaera sp.]|nr:release factor glutamine methyltransferase [Humisphaera sp.]